MKAFVRNKPWKWAALVTALATTCEVRAERYQATDKGAKPPTAASGPASSIPQPAVVPQQEQVVVLQDGGVMRGRVHRNGERYVLVRGTGETFIPANNVMFVAASLEDAYQQRRKRLGQPTADAHLVLAEWCLRHDLQAHAGQELAEARALEPHHGRLELLERRLSLANERQQKQADAVARAASEPPPVAPQMPSDITDVGDLPAGAVERFTRKVQPVLVNSCTLAGCHERGGTAKFQLDRAMLRGMSNRRSTMNNLAATLTLVDRQDPRHSPLLTVPRQAHGGMKEPVFGPRREAAFRHLYEWVALVTADTAKPAPASLLEGNAELVAAEPSANLTSPVMRVERPAMGGVVPAGYQQQAVSNISESGESQSLAKEDMSPAKTPLRYGARLEHWQPRDAFDPEIFNRKYAPRADVNANSEASKPARKAKR